MTRTRASPREERNPFDEVEKTVASSVRPGDVIGEWFRIESKLGEGGMGTVWAAHDTMLDRPVAVKLLAVSLCGDSDLVARFEREGRALARLEHPHIVPIYSVGRKGPQPYLVMKRLEGSTLQAYRERLGGRLPPEAVVPLMRQLCSGLGHLHRAGFVHRDLKPGNVFVGRGPHAYLLDLGVVRDRNASSTQTGTVIGTAMYMSPEQAMGTRELDARSDLYSLGVVLFELLAGVTPFEAATDHELMRAHVQRTPPPLRSRVNGVPEAFDRVIQRALEKEPGRRFTSAAEMLDALERAAEPSVATVVEMRAVERRALNDESEEATRRDGMAALPLEPADDATEPADQTAVALPSLSPPSRARRVVALLLVAAALGAALGVGAWRWLL